MLYDVIIRLLAAAGLITITNANGITTSSVVVSVCIFLILEVSLLFNDKRVYSFVTLIPFVIAGAYVWGDPYDTLKLWAIVILGAFTAVSIILYEIMMKYKTFLKLYT